LCGTICRSIVGIVFVIDLRMSSSYSTSPALDAANKHTSRARKRRRRRKIRPATRYALITSAVAVVAIALQFVVHMARAEPRDARAIAERELEVNTLQPGEHVIRSVSVFMRPAIEYFRATRGLLVLTDKRLLYLGLQPRDLLAAPDLPPTFEERDFPL